MSEAIIKKNAPANKKKPAGKPSAKKVINIVVNVVLVIAIILAAICTFISFVTTSGNGVPSIFGLRLLSIQTKSMYPTFDAGDLIISVKVDDPRELRPEQDIITYWTIIDGERVLNTHRIVNVYDGGGYMIFETKGDGNNNIDPLTVHESELIGKYKFKITGVGKFFDYLQTSQGFLLIVLIPVLIFFIFHLIQFFRVLFEYQNIKNRLKYEQERGKAEDVAQQQKEEMERLKQERERMEAELREKLRAELLESMAKEKDDQPAAEAAGAGEEAADKTDAE